MFTARFFCNPGFTRVGKHIIKCRRGQWNAEFPVCTSMGMCDPDDFPVVPNGFKQKVRKFRGSVYKVKCNRGFSRYGPSLVHCDGGAWNTNNMPVCAGAGCDEATMGDILYGRSKRLMNGAVYEFQCDDDTTMEGSSMVYCDGASWNDTAPGCMSTAGLPSLEVGVDGVRSHDAVTAGQTVMLVCSSKGGFPDPLLNFTRNDEAVGSAREFRNTHTFIASDDDNNAVYKCLAQNELMHRPVVSEIVLNVNFGPADVSISGPDSLQLDSVSNFSCVSGVSHPPAEIHWSVTDGEGVELTEDTGVQVFESLVDWESNGWITTSNIVVSPSPAHPSLTLRCTATNLQLKNKVAAKKWVQLRYAPEKVTVTGPSKILSGEVLKLSCSSSPSIPASSLYWTVRQSDKTLEYAEPESEVVQKEDGSFITESLLTVPVTNGKGHDLRVECLANNEVLGEDYRAYYHLVDILSPPSVPVISGLPDGASILPGSPKSLICSAHAGSPAATLNWYRGDQMIESEYQVRGDSVMAEITFVPRPDDTELRCEAR